MERGAYYRKFGWKLSPFIKSSAMDIPIVERHGEYAEIQECINGWDRIIVVTAPIGYGKTTFMNQLIRKKPPEIDYLVSFDAYEEPEEVMQRITNALPFWKRWNLSKTDHTSFGGELSKRLGNKKMLLTFDEAQDYKPELYKWLRIVNDRAANVFMAFFGLPGLEDIISAESSFRDRKSKSITLKPLSVGELGGVVELRIRWAQGTGTKPFTDEGLRRLCESAHHVPRLLLDNGQKVIEYCARNDIFTIDASTVEKGLGDSPAEQRMKESTAAVFTDKEDVKQAAAEQKMYINFMEELSPTQQDIMRLLLEKESLSIPEISEALNKDIRSLGSLIRKLRGLNEAEVKRKPNVPYPLIVRVGKSVRLNRRVDVYALSDNARRLLARS
ncbi:AAA domain protein [uncultured archaeon]|nr:AAA domain protein [uncultured archaeon]